MTTAISPIRKPQAWESSSTCTIEQRLSAHRIELRLDNPARPEILGKQRPIAQPSWQLHGEEGDGAWVIVHFRRSEEHTSELQSLMRISYAVFCLKKQNKKSEMKYKITRNE